MGVLSVLLFSFCWLCDRDVAADRTFSTFISSFYQILFLHLVFSIAAWVFWNLRWAESFRLPFLLFTSVDCWLSYDLHMAVPFLWAVFDTIYYLLYSTFDILFSAFRWIKTLRETFAVVCKILDLLFLCVFLSIALSLKLCLSSTLSLSLYLSHMQINVICGHNQSFGFHFSSPFIVCICSSFIFLVSFFLYLLSLAFYQTDCNSDYLLDLHYK